MKLIKTAVFFALIVFFVSCKKEDVTGDPNYPTTIEPLTEAEIDQVLIDLSETSLYQCTSVDTFGHCYVTLKNKACKGFDSIYVDYSRKELNDIFYESIIKYGEFINVTDTTGIRISSIRNMNGMDFSAFDTTYSDSATAGWIISSNLQSINGYEIPGTEIKLQIIFDQVRSIEGKRYNNLYLPATDLYTEEQAKNSLLGEEFTYSSSSIRITEESNWNESKKIIFPITIANKIELRVCWALHPSTWMIVVDTQTGEVLSSVKL